MPTRLSQSLTAAASIGEAAPGARKRSAELERKRRVDRLRASGGSDTPLCRRRATMLSAVDSQGHAYALDARQKAVWLIRWDNSPAEALTLHQLEKNVTGYLGVKLKERRDGQPLPGPRAEQRVGRSGGSFDTAEEAALAVARFYAGYDAVAGAAATAATEVEVVSVELMEDADGDGMGDGDDLGAAPTTKPLWRRVRPRRRKRPTRRWRRRRRRRPASRPAMGQPDRVHRREADRRQGRSLPGQRVQARQELLARHLRRAGGWWRRRRRAVAAPTAARRPFGDGEGGGGGGGVVAKVTRPPTAAAPVEAAAQDERLAHEVGRSLEQMAAPARRARSAILFARIVVRFGARWLRGGDAGAGAGDRQRIIMVDLRPPRLNGHELLWWHSRGRGARRVTPVGRAGERVAGSVSACLSARLEALLVLRNADAPLRFDTPRSSLRLLGMQ